MKEQDIRNATVLERYIQLSTQDAVNYFTSPNREPMACIACSCPDTAFEFEKAGFAYKSCRHCGTLFQTPRPPLSEFVAFYNDSPSSTYWAETFFPSFAEKRRSLIFKPRAARIAEFCKERGLTPRTIADVGAGYGIFLEEWRNVAKDARLVAIEPGDKLAQVCREKGLEVVATVAEEAAAMFGQADLVTSFEVIEHVHQPSVFVKSLYNLCRPGGLCVVSGLGVDGFDIQVLWEKSNSVSPPHHINFLSVEGFTLLFEKCGFTNIEVITPGLLDLDIVKNRAMKDPEILASNRFLKNLLNSSETTQREFQSFLSQNKLSSHVWILAERSAETNENIHF